MTLDQIAKQTNYQTKNSLSKAFKKHFGISTTEYKKQKKQSLLNTKAFDFTYEIKSAHNQHVLYVEVASAYKNKSSYRAKWCQIFNYMNELGIEKDQLRLISVSLDDTLITPVDQCRFYIGAMIPNHVTVGSKYKKMQLPDGKYAVFKHIGYLSDLHKVYQEIYETWLPQSGYYANGTISFEMYLNSPHKVDLLELTTEIYIPIKKRK